VLAARSAVHDILTTQHIDVVASHFALFTGGCLDLIKHLPLVVHFHGPWAAESRVEGGSRIITSGQFFLEKLVYSRAARIIVLSHAFGAVVHRSYGVPMERIRVIPGGVDVERFDVSLSKAQARLRLGLPLNRPIVVSVRRLAKRMGLENLIAAFARMAKKSDALLVIVGAGHLVDTLKHQVQECALSDYVVFAGRVPEVDLPLYYRAADVSIVPSVALEGFGLVVAESLACGTPPIVTPVGGLPESVSDLSEHLVLRNGDPETIADRLHAALQGTLSLPSSEACVSYARTHFNWSSIAKQVKSVYGEVL
jgi:glycosyltransferase involved in cell wall biosynthesis